MTQADTFVLLGKINRYLTNNLVPSSVVQVWDIQAKHDAMTPMIVIRPTEDKPLLTFGKHVRPRYKVEVAIFNRVAFSLKQLHIIQDAVWNLLHGSDQLIGYAVVGRDKGIMIREEPFNRIVLTFDILTLGV